MRRYIYILFFLIPFNISPAESKIINGNNVNSLSYPWMVSIIDLDASVHGYFGGVLVASDWVVTAAHCLNIYCDTDITADRIKVVAGSYDLNKPQQRVSVTEIIRHPDFNCRTLDSDIALLKLETDVDLSPVKLSLTNISDNTDAVTMGWGIIGYETRPDLPGWKNPVYSDILQELAVNIIPNSECSEFYPDELTDNMICADAEKNKGVCIGDSGGPLVIQNEVWELAGIISWGADEGCASGKPDVFTRVSEFRDFIYEHIGYPDMPYDYNDDQRIGMEDAIYVIRSIVVENGTELDISAAIKILQITSGLDVEL
ncbi:MAG: serine protease [Desulfobacterales bacterium]|nr:serine protease [Desulfobacterales bacterium]